MQCFFLRFWFWKNLNQNNLIKYIPDENNFNEINLNKFGFRKAEIISNLCQYIQIDVSLFNSEFEGNRRKYRLNYWTKNIKYYQPSLKIYTSNGFDSYFWFIILITI